MRFDPMRVAARLPHAICSLAAATAIAMAPAAPAADAPRGANTADAGPSGAAKDARTPLAPLIDEAVRTNPEIQAARKEQEAAAQRIAPSGALDDPMLEAGLVSVPANSLRLDREDMTMKMIGLSQRFPYPGKRGLREDVASRDAEAAGHGYRETANRIVRDLKIAYFDLALALATTTLVEKNRSVIGQFLRIAESRYQVGQGSQADVLKAHTQLSRMTEELLKLARDRPVLEAEINRLLGRGVGAAAPVPVALTIETAALSFETLHASALQSRPQLLAIERTIARNEKALELARKDYYPDFDVRFSYGQRDNMPDGTRRADLVSLTVAINLPVWRERKRAPRVAEAQAMLDQARMTQQALRNDLAAKLRQQAAAAEQNLRSARLYEKEILPQAHLTVEAALAAYRVNRVDFTALLDSQMTVFSSEIALAGVVAGYNKALAEIDFLAGRMPDSAAQPATLTGTP